MRDVAPGAGLARRDFVRVGGMLAAGLSATPLLGACASIGRSRIDFNVEEATIVDFQVAMHGRRPRRRVAGADLSAANPGARPERPDAARGPGDQSGRARHRPDARRRSGAAAGPRSLLHGIPVLLKDNIATADKMETTAGALALVGARPRDRRHHRAAAQTGGRRHPRQGVDERVGVLQVDAGLERLERAGGQARNPYALEPDAVRLQLRLGDRRGGESRDGGDRHRDGRIDHLPIGRQRRGRASSRRSGSRAAPASFPSPRPRTRWEPSDAPWPMPPRS